jgi:Dolichyl-phosphate-mannose-protein mannosyltransferase
MSESVIRANVDAWPQTERKHVFSVASSPERIAVGLIFIFLIFHVVLTATLGLSSDESYGIGVSHDLRLSYFDHPPLSYWITHLFLPLLGDGRALRLPFVALFAGTTWILFLLTRQLFGAVTAVWAVVALNLTAFFTVGGGWVLPDGSLMFCLLAAAYTISRSLFSNDSSRELPSQWRTWIIAGLWIGLAGLSKYHAALFVIGLFVYLLTSSKHRTVLLHPAPWVGGTIALAIFTPVIIWNAEHHWASFAFQLGRADSYGSFPKVGQFLGNFGEQLLYLLPWIFLPLVTAAYHAVCRGRTAGQSWYCLCLGLPTILLFTLVPLWADRGLPHWQMPGWLMLYPLLGNYLAQEQALRGRALPWAAASAAGMVVLTFLLVGYVETGCGKRLVPAAFTDGDPTLDFVEWTPLRDELRRRGLLEKKGLFIVSGNAVDIGEIDQALDRTLPMQVYGMSKQYGYLVDPDVLVGRDALIIGRDDRIIGVGKALMPYFKSIEELAPFAFGRSGMKEIQLRILYGHDLEKPLPSPYLKGQD